MKNKLNKIALIILSVIAVISFSACDPQEEAQKDLGSVVSASDIKVTVTHDAQNPNIINFQLTTPECVGMFSCPEAGIKYAGMEFSKLIIFPGSYNVAVQVYNKAGISDTLKIPVIIENMDLSILAGGTNDPNGKTWRINGNVPGHIGCGPENATSNSWWNPAANSLPSALYDDNITFIQSGMKFMLDNKGASYMNESTASLFPDGDPGGSFVTTHYTPSPNATWNLEQSSDGYWLVINNGFPAYAATLYLINGPGIR